MAKGKSAIKCFSKVQIVNADGSIAGDSGWTGPNTVTTLGIQKFLTAGLYSTNTARIGWMNLASTNSTANASNCTIATNATTYTPEMNHKTARLAVTSATLTDRGASNTYSTMYLYGTFASSDSFITGTGAVLGGVGLFDVQTTGAGTCFAANTYAGSSCASNQAVNVTYQIQLGANLT